MMRQVRAYGSLKTLVVGLAVLVCSPLTVVAETVVFRNDSKVALIVQCAYVVKGTVKSDKPFVIRPGATLPIATLPGAKLITVCPASMPNKVLHQSTIPGSKDDQAYILAPNAAGTRIDLEQVKPGGGGGVAPEEKTKPAPEPPKSGLPPK
jgi:hypothetical protein